VLYSFTGGADGGSPDGTLAFISIGETGGPFYGTTTSGGAGYILRGTTVYGGAYGKGVVYQFAP